jgi:hypothetical protein
VRESPLREVTALKKQNVQLQCQAKQIPSPESVKTLGIFKNHAGKRGQMSISTINERMHATKKESWCWLERNWGLF